MQAALSQLTDEVSSKDAEITKRDVEINSLRGHLEAKNAEIAALKASAGSCSLVPIGLTSPQKQSPQREIRNKLG